MLKLQRHFRPFLRYATIFEGVGKLTFLSNAHQELRLRKKVFAAQPGALARTGERGEIDVGSQVLLARGLIRVRTGGVLAICHERAAIAARELLLARVTVIHDEQQAAADEMRDLPDPILRNDGHFDALARFGMDSVTVEEFQFVGKRREPSFIQAIIFERDVKFAVRAENLDGKSIEEFIGENNQWSFRRESPARASRPFLHDCGDCGSAGIQMLAQSFLEPCSQRGRSFLQGVSEGAEEIAEFLVGPIEHITGKQASTRARFEDLDFRRPVERSPDFIELPSQQASENGVHVARSVEVSGFAELFGIGGIVTMGGIVEANLHVARKRDGTAQTHFLLDLFADGQGG